MFEFIKRIFIKNKLYHDIINSLVTALEAKDQYTKGHSERVADMTYELSSALGIKGVQLEMIHIAAHLHDIGKIGVPDSILNKRGKLYDHEWEYIREHPKIGYEILYQSKELKQISKIVLYHHERWDGKGYIYGLRGEEIPLGSRIIAICDSIDAMTSKRPYRNPMDWEKCKEEIINNRGIMYDPLIVDCVEENWSKIVGVVK